MRVRSAFRSAVFVMLGSVALCAQAFAQDGPAVRLGAVSDLVDAGSIGVDGQFTDPGWAAVRPVAFKLDETSGALFSTIAEDPAADGLVYVARSADQIVYLFFDMPVLKDTVPPTAGKVLFSVTIPRKSGPSTATFVAVGNGSFDVNFGGYQGPMVNGLTGAGRRFVPSPTDEEGVAHFQFELAVPQNDLQADGDGVIWSASRTTVINQLTQEQPLSRLVTSRSDPLVFVQPAVDVPMAAISVTQYVRDILTELRPRLTRNADRARLGEAIAQVTKALGPALYLDEGHLTRKNGRKVFRFDQDAVRTLRGLLGRLGFTESLPPNPDTIPQCRSNVPTDGVINPLYGCAQLLFGIDREVAGRAVDDYALSTGFSTTLTWATARLTEGDEDWNAGEIEAIDDYSEAWELVTR